MSVLLKMKTVEVSISLSMIEAFMAKRISEVPLRTTHRYGAWRHSLSSRLRRALAVPSPKELKPHCCRRFRAFLQATAPTMATRIASTSRRVSDQRGLSYRPMSHCIWGSCSTAAGELKAAASKATSPVMASSFRAMSVESARRSRKILFSFAGTRGSSSLSSRLMDGESFMSGCRLGSVVSLRSRRRLAPRIGHAASRSLSRHADEERLCPATRQCRREHDLPPIVKRLVRPPAWRRIGRRHHGVGAAHPTRLPSAQDCAAWRPPLQIPEYMVQATCRTTS